MPGAGGGGAALLLFGRPCEPARAREELSRRLAILACVQRKLVGWCPRIWRRRRLERKPKLGSRCRRRVMTAAKGERRTVPSPACGRHPAALKSIPTATDAIVACESPLRRLCCTGLSSVIHTYTSLTVCGFQEMLVRPPRSSQMAQVPACSPLAPLVWKATGVLRDLEL